jgi:glycerate dehydrogenase
MRIVVLDGYTLNPGYLSWDELEALGACAMHDRPPPRRSRDARAARARLMKTAVDNLRAFING